MADKLREFLVALGFKVDDQQREKFEGTITKATKAAMALGAAVTATAATISVAVKSIADDFTDLYYAAQRTGSTIRTLQAFQFGAQQIGVSAATARQAVENLARSMRLQPGISGLLNTLGVKTGGRDPTQIMTDLVGQLKKLPPYLAAQYGQMLGIDPDTLVMMVAGFEKARVEAADFSRRQREAGVDTKQLGDQSVKFSQDLARAWSNVGILWERVSQNVLPILDHVVVGVDKIVVAVNNASEAMGGWVSTIALAAGAIGLLTIKGLLLRGALRFLGIGGGAAAAAEGGAVAAGAATGAAGGAAGAAAGGAAAGWVARLLGGAAGVFFGSTSPAGSAAERQWELDNLRDMKTSRGGAGERQSSSRAGGAGGAPLYSATIDMTALAKQLLAYGKSGSRTISDIVARASPNDRMAESVSRDVSRRTGFAPGEELDFSDPAVLDKIMSAIAYHFPRLGSNSDGLEQAAANARLGFPSSPLVPSPGAGGGGVSVSQKTDINVYGGGDPAATAGAVRKNQDRVNGDLVRNLSGVVQ